MPSAEKSSYNFDNLWMPFSYYRDTLENPPIVIEKGEGVWIIDNQGKRYLDAVGSWWVSILGHNHPYITNAVRRQLDKIEHVIMAGFISEPSLRLSEMIKNILPSELTRIFYSDDGSTAVEIALKIAMQYHALRSETRPVFVSFEGGYHGDTLGAMSVGMIPQYHALFHQQFKKQLFAHSPYCYRCPVNCTPENCHCECMDSLERILQEHNKNIAACIFEPMVQGAVGMRVYPSKVLKRIFSLCKQYNVLTIADEVAMGFGRTGKLFACEHAGEVPDIMCIAKGLTGGYLPLSATVVKEFIFDEFKGDYKSNRILNHGHTFTGNPLAASAACATIELITSMHIPQSIETKIHYFHEKLSVFKKFDIVGDIRALGMCAALELVADKASKRPLPVESRFSYILSNKAVARGLLLRPLGDTIYFMPPFIITEKDIDFMIDTTSEVLQETINECLTPL
ncbi:MAG: adenosylmethionine--8-amino-7-oxononanoate transaminase [Chitinispirillaceae bacterium]|nr:adenosylmethionine--8-amino-7-oxononanoate transaminase [Chitinispirillaceae bacterium]